MYKGQQWVSYDNPRSLALKICFLVYFWYWSDSNCYGRFNTLKVKILEELWYGRLIWTISPARADVLTHSCRLSKLLWNTATRTSTTRLNHKAPDPSHLHLITIYQKSYRATTRRDHSSTWASTQAKSITCRRQSILMIWLTPPERKQQMQGVLKSIIFLEEWIKQYV